MVLTILHAGGKFDGNNYKTAGGLHGVGASVVNALSKKLVAVVKRDGAQYRMEFSKGEPKTKLAETQRERFAEPEPPSRFRPIPTIFPKTDFNPDTIRQRLEITSFLHRGVKVHFVDDVNKTKETFFHEQGIVDYLGKVLKERNAKPIHETPFTLNGRRARANRTGACNGPNRPTNTFVRMSTAFPRPMAARTKTDFAPG